MKQGTESESCPIALSQLYLVTIGMNYFFCNWFDLFPYLAGKETTLLALKNFIPGMINAAVLDFLLRVTNMEYTCVGWKEKELSLGMECLQSFDSRIGLAMFFLPVSGLRKASRQ